jgi:predicted phage-related endonuclease
VMNGEAWDFLVQIKNVGAWVHKAWQEQPPAYVVLQEQWELYVTGLQRADIAVLIGGNDYREYTVWRDDKMIGDLVAIAGAFWLSVQKGIEPEVDGTDECARALVERATSSGILVPRSADVDALVETYRRERAETKALAESIALTKNRLRKLMVDAQADGIETEDEPLLWPERADGTRSLQAPRSWDRKEAA